MGRRRARSSTTRGVRVTLIEPGMVATPFFENDVSAWALPADAVADAVMYAVSRPKTVDVSDIMVRPIVQPA